MNAIVSTPNANDALVNVADGMAIAIRAAKSSLGSADVNVGKMARTMLAALMSDVSTQAVIGAEVLTAYGNPKLKSGKAMTSVTSSARDDIKGFGAMRRNVKSVFTVHDNINSAPDIRAMVTAFVLNDRTYTIGDVTHDTPKFLHTLLKAVNASIAAHVKATAAPVDADTAKDAGDGVEETPIATVPAGALVERVAELIVAFDAATDVDRDMAMVAINALIARVNGYVVDKAAIAAIDDAVLLAA